MRIDAETARRTQPMHDRVLVKRIPDPEHMTTTLIIPDIAQGASTWCRVVAVGPGKFTKKGMRIPCDVKKGDLVRIGPYTDGNFDEGDFAFIVEADIRGKLA